MKLKIFLDSNIFIAGLGSKIGASAEVLKLIQSVHIETCTSKLVVEEVKRNLTRKLPQYLPIYFQVLSKTGINIYSNARITNNRISKTIPKHSDVIIFNTAQKLHIDYFITLNRKHFHQKEVKKIANFKIITPAEFLAIFRKNFFKN
ncbi:MAG: PilT protein domain-containing protein [Candidatus Berkelbacteria bacterium Licking1014_7]|uniref:PilT protein domain-containing protein n=1 Tax=Candidatus Berkelbacteria bacterium Licking1014_7 TaxID=2017147 RepID=A0A554LIR8_9BACT|nr:MAG: PilT protein domain-containing protein [Candidatus Berkelbacteria bacterium Licking1014_7]